MNWIEHNTQLYKRKNEKRKGKIYKEKKKGEEFIHHVASNDNCQIIVCTIKTTLYSYPMSLAATNVAMWHTPHIATLYICHSITCQAIHL